MPRREQATPLLKAVGENIKSLRMERDWTREELGRMSGVSPGSLHSIEAGRVNITIETLQKLAKALEIPMSEILSGI